MGASVRLKYMAKSALRPLLFRHAPIGLQPERLHMWLGVLKDTQDLTGSVVEVGCSVGGTAAFSGRMLKRLGVEKRYVCVDTFGGFVEGQFSDDLERGTRKATRTMFDANSVSLVRRNLDALGAPQVELVQGDIVTVAEDALPPAICAGLVDVDLSEPVYVALKRLYARLQPGGVLLVDDCPEGYHWKAREGYLQFVEEYGLPPVVEYGMGVVSRPRLAGS
ncbi:TylF/MycF/NovP-related O-methyltransferase [Blastococcus sp. CT_GayMR16]|uniref:TylF/MycF/NovP-related O-methyltransferase n=1 Tax=Blastococcus sp. CT_GayMR16 TaxID=2559607 RepID=UPI0014315E01|nr:TylF/MycF/NovP-related O-methyltransferase [Blastococcus sp. CT_GayMR16]